MGRTTRWLKGLFGMTKKKEKSSEKRAFNSNHSSLLSQNPRTTLPNITPAEAAWLRSFYEDGSESETQQSKHAIAVAAATTAAAEAAVAAAQAATVVVRLTSQGRGAMPKGIKENLAAVKIQTTFRSFLARKALKALRGVVKLQAIVRGFLARKQAHAQKCRRLIPTYVDCTQQSQPRKSLEYSDDIRIDQRIIPRHSSRLPTSFEISNVMTDFDESPKIVEVDTVGSKSRTRTMSWMRSHSGELAHNQTTSSLLPCPNPPCPSTPDRWNFNSSFESGGDMLAGNAPFTLPKSVCVDGYFGSNNGNLVPSYMASTQSFEAKLRSQSTPKQRPEPSSRRRFSVEKMESRSILGGFRRQRSYSHAQEVINFKNTVPGKFSRSCDFANEQEKGYYIQ